MKCVAPHGAVFGVTVRTQDIEGLASHCVIVLEQPALPVGGVSSLRSVETALNR